MAHLASILYAPFILIALRYIPVFIVASVMLIISLVWSYRIRKEPIGAFLLPFFYGVGAILALLVGNETVLKAIPLFIAIAFCLFFLSPQGGKWLSVMAARVGNLDEKERQYVYKCRYFWASVALVNVGIHALAILNFSVVFWAFYASVGWYGIFLIGGVLQFLHRKFVFKKEVIRGI